MIDDASGPKTERAPLPAPAPAFTGAGRICRARRADRGRRRRWRTVALAGTSWLFERAPGDAARLAWTFELFAAVPVVVVVAAGLTLRAKAAGPRLLLGTGLFGTVWAVLRAVAFGLREPRDVLSLERPRRGARRGAVLALRRRREAIDASAARGGHAPSAVAWVLPFVAAAPFAILQVASGQTEWNALALLRQSPLFFLVVSLASPRAWRGTLYVLAAAAATAVGHRGPA